MVRTVGSLVCLGMRSLLEGGPLSGTSAGVKELESGVRDLEGIALPLLVILDVQQIASQVVLGRLIGRLLEPLCELTDGAEIGFMCPVGEASQLHVVEHLLGEW